MNNFISEKELQERRKKREEEWERVRKPGDPEEMPEEPYDPRSLYERLQEQKDKKQMDFEESIKFKNQFRGVNKDEAAFLDHVANQAAKLEKKRNDEIKKELEDFRKARSEQVIDIKTELPKKTEEKTTTNKKRSAQSALIMKAVKRKKSTNEDDTSNMNTDENAPKNETDAVSKSPAAAATSVVYPSAQKCVGILPGIGSYSDDSDSTSLISSGSESDCN